MALVSFTISNTLTKKDIAHHCAPVDDVNLDDYNNIKNQGLSLLNKAASLEIGKRYKKEIGNHFLFYLCSKDNTFYQVITHQIHVDPQIENAAFELINEAERESIRKHVDEYDTLTPYGKSTFNGLILRYQEMLSSKGHSARSETLDSIKRSEPTEMNDVKEEVEVGRAKPEANANISYTSLYGDNSKTTLFYFRIARGIVWSLSFSISMVSIYLILTTYTE